MRSVVMDWEYMFNSDVLYVFSVLLGWVVIPQFFKIFAMKQYSLYSNHCCQQVIKNT